MNQRVSEYFAREAGDYLEQLDQLLAGPEEPNPAHLLRLARGVRGSAQMAGAETVAGVAVRLEDAVRSVTSHNIVWSDEIRRLAQQTVEDLRILLRALNRWGPEEERRVREAIDRWAELETGGRAVAAAGRGPEPVPIESLFYDDEGPHVVAAPPVVSEAAQPPADVVPIESLLLRGDDALREALALRSEAERIVEAGGIADSRLSDLLEEVFDLVELGRSTAPQAG